MCVKNNNSSAIATPISQWCLQTFSLSECQWRTFGHPCPCSTHCGGRRTEEKDRRKAKYAVSLRNCLKHTWVYTGVFLSHLLPSSQPSQPSVQTMGVSSCLQSPRMSQWSAGMPYSCVSECKSPAVYSHLHFTVNMR